MGNGILGAGEKLKRKLSLRSYEVSSPEEAPEMVVDKVAPEPKRQSVKTLQRRHVKPHRLTVYLSDEEKKALDEVYIKRLRDGEKMDRSSLIGEAVQVWSRRELKN